MTFFGPSTRVEQIDQPDALEFHIAPVLLGYHLLLAGMLPACVVASIANAWLGVLAGAAGAGIWCSFKGNDKRERVLRITDTLIEAYGREEWVRLPWAQVIRLEYLEGDENSPSGLVAKTDRWSWTMLVSEVGHGEAQTIMNAIWSRFPVVENAVEPPGLLEKWMGRDDSILLKLKDHR